MGHQGWHQFEAERWLQEWRTGFGARDGGAKLERVPLPCSCGGSQAGRGPSSERGGRHHRRGATSLARLDGSRLDLLRSRCTPSPKRVRGVPRGGPGNGSPGLKKVPCSKSIKIAWCSFRIETFSGFRSLEVQLILS